MSTYDFTVIGGGIVGLSAAMALGRRYPKAHVLLLEKEARLAAHQTGRNSGVIHSGIYYTPGSYKAKFCQDGNRAILEFCRRHGIPFDVCGKVIVATDAGELPLLENLYQRGLANGLVITKITAGELREIEPHVRGLAGIRVPATGIVDYARVADAFADVVAAQGGEVRLSSKVEAIGGDSHTLTVETSTDSHHTRFLINCAGLHSDRIARLMHVHTGMRIMPVRGEYYTLTPEKRSLVKHLIYPVPNPRFPFLGVHFTRMIDGSVHAGPNAVLSLKREGYLKTDVNLRDCLDLFLYPAFWRVAAANAAEGAKEMVRSLSKAVFVRSLQKLVPEVRAEDLVPCHAGVRAQALMDDGRLMDDFHMVVDRRSLHVCNAPSPAATASIPVGQTIVERIPEQSHLGR